MKAMRHKRPTEETIKAVFAYRTYVEASIQLKEIPLTYKQWQWSERKYKKAEGK